MALAVAVVGNTNASHHLMQSNEKCTHSKHLENCIYRKLRKIHQMASAWSTLTVIHPI